MTTEAIAEAVRQLLSLQCAARYPAQPAVVAHLARCFVAIGAEPAEALRRCEYGRHGGINRDPRNIEDRQLAWWLARTVHLRFGPVSYPELSAASGNRRGAHSTVIDGVRRIRTLRKTQPDHVLAKRAKAAMDALAAVVNTKGVAA